MKLSNLSLAILVAMGVAACGGSDSNDAPKDPQTPSTPTPPPPVVPPSTDNVLVDPTGTDVVENFNPAETPSVGTLQYIRRAGSQYDRTKNPEKDGSATPLLNVDLDQQNPKLTNIVLARKNEDKVAGTPQLVQFFGGTSGEAFAADGTIVAEVPNKTYNALQVHNFKNVDLLVGHLGQGNSPAGHTVDSGARINPVAIPAALEFPKPGNATAVAGVYTYDEAHGKADAEGATIGKGLVWWTAGALGLPDGQGTAFENNVTRTGLAASDTGSDATNGLIRVGGRFKDTEEALPTLGQEKDFNKTTNKWEDHHKTTTRIFGRYHLGYVPQAGAGVGSTQPVSLNSFDGAKSFVAKHQTKDDFTTPVELYSLGANPITLEHVQYGRVTNNLDEASAIKVRDTFWHSPDLVKGDGKSVDNYFYRGTGETSIADMTKLASDQVVKYKGHALMYGIDNSFHSTDDKGKPLPNAFLHEAAPEAIGLGNFVEAEVLFGKNEVAGYVYNAWLVNNKTGEVVKNNLVRFDGRIQGNTVIGNADRTYIAGNEKADFRASFFGSQANEMGGSFNSITTDQKYGDEVWGGVFGAKRSIDVKPDSNTFLGDDGNSVYSL